jgi:hypothetical protein
MFQSTKENDNIYSNLIQQPKIISHVKSIANKNGGVC